MISVAKIIRTEDKKIMKAVIELPEGEARPVLMLVLNHNDSFHERMFDIISTRLLFNDIGFVRVNLPAYEPVIGEKKKLRDIEAIYRYVSGTEGVSKIYYAGYGEAGGLIAKFAKKQPSDLLIEIAPKPIIRGHMPTLIITDKEKESDTMNKVVKIENASSYCQGHEREAVAKIIDFFRNTKNRM